MSPVFFYLAGPMRGRPRHNAEAFAEAREALRAKGHEVWCPMEASIAAGFDPDYPNETARPLADYMRRDLDAVCRAWAVVVLPGWRESRGARAELAVAWALGTPVMEWPSLRLISIRVAVDSLPERDGLSAASPADRSNAPDGITQGTSKILTSPANLPASPPAVGPLADTSHDGLWRRAAWPGEVIL